MRASGAGAGGYVMYDKLEGVENVTRAGTTAERSPPSSVTGTPIRRPFREHSELGKIVAVFRRYKEVLNRVGRVASY